MNLIEIDSENDLPVNVRMRMYQTTDVEAAQARFEKQHGFKCKVAFKLRDKMLMVIDKDYEVTNGK